MIIRGVGLATPLSETIDGWQRDALPVLAGVLAAYPRAHVIRNDVGNLSIIVPTDDGSDFEYIACVDVRTGDADRLDEDPS